MNPPRHPHSVGENVLRSACDQNFAVRLHSEFGKLEFVRIGALSLRSETSIERSISVQSRQLRSRRLVDNIEISGNHDLTSRSKGGESRFSATAHQRPETGINPSIRMETRQPEMNFASGQVKISPGENPAVRLSG